MIKVYIDNDLVFHGYMAKVGGGGTKTAYALSSSHYVVLLPNEVDGVALERAFPRICYEEQTFYNYLSENSLAPCLPVKECTVDTGSKSLPGLYAPSFYSYADRGEHVIDSKDVYKCTWSSSIMCINPNFFEPDSWLPIFAPLVQDLKRLAAAGIVPLGDCLNFLITSTGSEHHVDPAVPYQVRFFGFDFSSKRYISERALAIQALEPGTLLKPVTDSTYLQEALDLAVDLIVSITKPQRLYEEDSDIQSIKTLYTSVLQKVVELR